LVNFRPFPSDKKMLPLRARGAGEVTQTLVVRALTKPLFYVCLPLFLKSFLDLFIDMGYSPYCSIHLFFCNLFISRKPINGRDWPARSPPDLNPCDFFLWGYLKSKVYCPKPRTLDDLKNNIGLLQPNMIRRSMTLKIGP